jgi:hypothetical protein
MVDMDGRLVRFEFFAPGSDDPLRAGALVVDGGESPVPTPLSPGALLARLLPDRAVGRRAVSEPEATGIVRWLATVPGYTLSTAEPAPVVDALRSLCEPSKLMERV